VDETARLALHPHTLCLATASATGLAAKRTRHPQPPQRHENAQIRTNKAKQNQQAQCDEANPTKHAIAGKEEGKSNGGEQKAATNLRKVKPESKRHRREAG
jgi:hypothetical protein